MTTMAATGVYEALFVMPTWFADVPKSLALMRNRKSIKFWIPLQIITIASVITSSILNWNISTIHTTLVAADICFGLVWISTAVFFVPGVIAFQKLDLSKPAPLGLAARGHRWLRLSWLRQGAMIASALCFAITLAVI